MSAPEFASQIEAQREYLVRYARSQVNDPDAAEDLAQETLLAALTAAPRFEQRSTLRTWLTGILRHKIIDMRRTRGREMNLSSLGFDGDDPRGTGHDDQLDLLHANAIASRWVVAQPDDPSVALERKRFMRDLHAGLKTLPANQRAALEMRELRGQESSDICATLGISSSNLWVMICRAKATLRESLGDRYGGLQAF